MNFRQKIILSLILTVALCFPLYAQVVNILDSNLAHAVREALGLPPNVQFTDNHLRQLNELDADEQNIADLTGLEYAINLHRLHISENPISNLTPIANLTTLTNLDAAVCALSDISPLVDLTNLTKLVLSANQITDISPLANLTNLNHLHLNDNQITRISPLATLTNLTHLSMSRNRIVDIRPLANLTRLAQLRIHRNAIADVSPLARLTKLEYLEIQDNKIADHAPLDVLPLVHFEYDQACEMPPLPLEPKLENRTFPSVFVAWAGIGSSPVRNQPYLSDIEQIAQYDLNVAGVSMFGFAIRLSNTNHGWKVQGDIREATQMRNDFLALNPSMIFLAEINMRTMLFTDFPENSPVWIRDAQGNLAFSNKNDGLVDFTHPVVQDKIVQQALAVERCGLYDGIFFDYWNEGRPVLVPEQGGPPYVGNEAEQQARDNILHRIRAEARSNFLIMGNVNKGIIPRTGSRINGGFMETGVPGSFTGTRIEEALTRVERSLLWLEQNIREPRINGLEGKAFPTEPPDSPANLRWMRAITALHLTHSDGYVRFKFDSDAAGGKGVFWYDFWDTDLGRPVGPKAQLYGEYSGLYIREFTNGWAVYNHSGEPQKITLPEEVISAESGLTDTVHALPNLDGGIYIKTTLSAVTPDSNGSDIFIAEPIDTIPGAVLRFDASNNPGAIRHWINLGTAGGRLEAADIPPRLEVGEIQIPSIGFSGKRNYYTATTRRQTFGGPVATNPKLYLADWTLEFLCKRNGNQFDREHHFAGFQNSPREGLQGIRLGLLIDGQELGMSIHAEGLKQPERALNIFLEENVWTWVTIVSLNGESIIAYQDGAEVSRHPGVHFDAILPIDDISIGANSYDERHRNFNGSFAIVRVYDRALRPEEVLQNIGATVIPITNPADVNGDGAVNILDLVVVAQGLGTDNPEVDVNGDGVVNVFDLVFVAGAIGGGGAAPSAYSLDSLIISAADVENWLALTQGISVGDPNFQRGIRFLEGLLAALTPKETTLLPNYPNPFNPETWIPYRLVREAEVAITIYDTKGRLVRRLALGNQAAGYYVEHGKAAYWDGTKTGSRLRAGFICINSGRGIMRRRGGW